MPILHQFGKVLQEMRYAYATIKSYKNAIELLLASTQKLPEEITLQDIEVYIQKKSSEGKMSASAQKQLLGALKLFYKELYSKELGLELLYPSKTASKLPTVLSKADVLQILDACKNLKHQCLLTCMYSSGLRLNEVLNLRVQDIDSKRMLLYIKDAANNKSREVMLSENFLALQQRYNREYLPSYWLFEGTAGKQYSARSVQQVFKDALAKSRIKKEASVYALRHSFASHLLESGTDIRYVQELLGHNSIKSTRIYAQLTTTSKAKIKSPLDM